MARATIDIAGLLKAFGVGSGTEVDPNNPNQPIKPSGFWSRLANPELSSTKDLLNLQYQTNPIMEGQRFDIEKSQAADMIRHGIKYATGKDPSDEEVKDAVGAYGTRVKSSGLSPGEVALSRRAVTNVRGGVPETEGKTDINKAEEMLVESNRSLRRQPTVEATKDADAALALSKAVNLDPTLLKTAIAKARAELDREPTEEEILNKAQELQKEEQSIAAEGQKVKRAVTETEVKNLPLTTSAMTGKAALENISAFNPGITNPSMYNIGKINPTDLSLSFGRNPFYFPEKLGMAGAMGANLPGMGGGERLITLPGGGAIALPAQSSIVRPTVSGAGFPNPVQQPAAGVTPLAPLLRAPTSLFDDSASMTASPVVAPVAPVTLPIDPAKPTSTMVDFYHGGGSAQPSLEPIIKLLRKLTDYPSGLPPGPTNAPYRYNLRGEYVPVR